MKTRLLIPIAVFLVLLPWIQGLSTGINNEVMVDGITTSAVIVMAITLAFSLISWALFSWATKNITFSGIFLAIILGVSLVIPFLQVLGPMAGILVGIVAGFVAFLFQQKMKHTAKNRPILLASTTLVVSYVILIMIVLTVSQTSHVWNTDNGIGSWRGTTDEIEESIFYNIFNSDIEFVFFFAIVPSLIITYRMLGEKNQE